MMLTVWSHRWVWLLLLLPTSDADTVLRTQHDDNCAGFVLQCGDGNTLISGSCYALSGTLRLDAPVCKDPGGAQVPCSTTGAVPYAWACSSNGGTTGELKATASCCGTPVPRE